MSEADMIESVLAFERDMAALRFASEADETTAWRPRELADFLDNLAEHRAAVERTAHRSRVQSLLRGYAFDVARTDGEEAATEGSEKRAAPVSHGCLALVGALDGVEAAQLEDAVLLFLAVVPSQYGDKLSDIPHLSATFYNDCTALAAVVERRQGDDRLAQLARYLRATAGRTLERLCAAQRRALLDVLAEAGDLSRTHKSQVYKTCAQAIRRLLGELRQLASALQQLLPRGVCLQLLGQLCEAIVSTVVARLQALDEICEKETHSLAELLALFDACPQLLGAHTVDKRVPSWSKLARLRTALALPLVEIMDLYHAGDLEEFTGRELRSLICALFADTPFRERHLRSIADDPAVSSSSP